jgi:hypothetical protein
MSLFDFSELNFATGGQSCPSVDKASGMALTLEPAAFLSGEKHTVIAAAIGDLADHSNVFFMTDGAWSNIDLIGYILSFTGTANIFFTTWSIAADTIAKLSRWKEKGQILSIHAILDQGIRNRKPEILQQAQGSFTNLKLIKCHAKVTVVQNERHSVVLMGSANFTRNPRKEVGMIIKSRELADANIKWILEEFL